MSSPPKRPLTALALTLTAALLIACGGSHPHAGAAPTTTVRAALATAERIEVAEEIALQGIVEADQSAAVSARVMAMVTFIHVHPGELVRRDQLLIEIDPQTSEGMLAQARGALGQATAALQLAERNYERFRALAESDAASELEVDMARTQYLQAQSAVEQAEGSVAAASSVAADTRVLAPYDGRIADKLVDVGELAAPGRPLLRIESVAGRRLAVAVPESLAHQAALAPGVRLRVRIDSRPDLGDLEGPVVEMAPGADPTSHSVLLKIELPTAELMTGAAGRTWIPTETRSRVAMPRGALLQQGGLQLAVVRDDEGRAVTRVVTVGGDLPDERLEVLSGLAGGETVLVGLEAVPPAGARVEEP